MVKRFGIPYQGSKNKIAEKIIAQLPPAEHLIDLFAGGCAISHCALLSGKFKHVHANDLSDSVTLFEDALNGDLEKYEPERFRSREDFFAEKNTNPFVRIIYSFSNDQRTYLYGKEIEPYKRAVHEMIYAPTPYERRLKFKAVIREMEKLGTILAPRKIKQSEDNTKSEYGGEPKGNGCLPETYGRLQSYERTELIDEIRRLTAR